MQLHLLQVAGIGPLNISGNDRRIRLANTNQLATPFMKLHFSRVLLTEIRLDAEQIAGLDKAAKAFAICSP